MVCFAGATSDENFAVEDKMFHKNAVKDSAKVSLICSEYFKEIKL